MSVFKESPVIANLLTRLAALEALVGAQPAQEVYADLDALRAETSHTDGDGALVGADSYVFDSSSTAADDGATVILPDNITHPAPGRWLRETRFALKDHTHTTKADKISSPNQDEFLKSDSDGNPVESGVQFGAYAAANHEHSGYLDNEDKTELEEGIEEAIQAGSNKMSAVTGMTKGDIGDIGTLNEAGQVQKSGKKTTYVPTKNMYEAMGVAENPSTDNPFMTKSGVMKIKRVNINVIVGDNSLINNPFEDGETPMLGKVMDEDGTFPEGVYVRIIQSGDDANKIRINSSIAFDNAKLIIIGCKET